MPASGTLIFFELVSDGHSRIVSFDPKTKVLERLTPEGANAHSPAVSLDGNKLAYVSGERLFVLGEGPLVTPIPVDDAAWFPRGNHLAFSGHGVIYDSNGMRPLASFVAGDQSEPAVSPDGEWLAFTSTHRGIRHIWIENIATSVAREITGDVHSFAPTWELDSTGLVFASDCSCVWGYRDFIARIFRRCASLNATPVKAYYRLEIETTSLCGRSWRITRSNGGRTGLCW